MKKKNLILSAGFLLALFTSLTFSVQATQASDDDSTTCHTDDSKTCITVTVGDISKKIPGVKAVKEETVEVE